LFSLSELLGERSDLSLECSDVVVGLVEGLLELRGLGTLTVSLLASGLELSLYRAMEKMHENNQIFK